MGGVRSSSVIRGVFAGGWGVREGSAQAGLRGAPGDQDVLQVTVGQVQLPLVWMVTPQLLPLPFGLAVSTCELG
ncbi:hypothetical protein GCM10018782_43420 [Streptomyces griseoaurantiacus]|nr:hypothetical protein GCM10018782_43420 [Streptomyces griseoaurantiacus]